MWPWRSRQSRDNELDRELRDHLDLEAEEQEAKGLSSPDARYAAHRALGNTTLIKEQVRDLWTSATIDQFMQDVRHSLRLGARAPGFALVAILSLTLGIGATTAVFSVLNAVALQPLPVRHPDSPRRRVARGIRRCNRVDRSYRRLTRDPQAPL